MRAAKETERGQSSTRGPIVAIDRILSAPPAGGIVLVICAALALVWANSVWASSYVAFWDAHLPTPIGSGASFTLRDLVNDGLMAIFFFLVGLEIKRELLVGHLATVRKAALPIAAAFGGMVVPALIFAAINASTHAVRGWGIPMATDIAFALGVLALLGNRVPTSLRTFLSALAIADDLGAVLVIALFYTATISWIALAAAALLVALAVIANRTGMRATWLYALIGIALWAAVLVSGVHPTVAGVLLAFTIPSRATAGDQADGLLVRMERGLNRPVTFGIMPVFALANAGVSLHGSMHLLSAPVATGVILGLFLGKPVGICVAIWGAVRSGIAVLPDGATRGMLFGVACLGGIGFTMSLFIAGLAFGTSAELLTAAKLGTFTASIFAGVAGWLLLRHATRTRNPKSSMH